MLKSADFHTKHQAQYLFILGLHNT